MRRWILLLVAVLSLAVLNATTNAQTLTVGQKFLLDRIAAERGPADNSLVVFMPSLTYDCEYASMLTQSFHYYFEQGLAFEGLGKQPKVRIYLIVGDKPNEQKSTQNRLEGMTVVFDEKGVLFSAFGLTLPKDKNADSRVLLLDSEDKIAFLDPGYRAQGEHLKPLEAKLRELSGIQSKLALTRPANSLRVGDPAPDFLINANTRLSSLRGEVVLISFYPAAFSGLIPKPFDPSTITLTTATISPIKFEQMMICSVQLDKLDKIKVQAPREPKRIAVSSSTPSLLKKWSELLGTHHIVYANDPDYSIANAYFSYNPGGYCNRVSVIVDKKGKIAYIDESFDAADDEILNAKMAKLLR
jgi:peroxiredoxin